MQPSADVQGVVLSATEWIRFALEAAGALVIAVGAIAAVVELARSLVHGHRANFRSARLELSRYLTLTLEFQLAADVLDTAISEDWTKIGQLAAIAAIRTALNYSLSRELKEERGAVAPAPDASTTT